MFMSLLHKLKNTPGIFQCPYLIRNELLIIVIFFQINFSVGLTEDIASGKSTVSYIFTILECLIDVGWLM